MPIDPAVVAQFLGREWPNPPNTKGMEPGDLRQMIFDVTGVEYTERTKSRQHQLEGTAFALHQQRALMFFWMRLGKSKMALDWCAHLRKSALVRKKGLILTHAPVGSDVWMGQVAAHSHLKAVVVRAGPNAGDIFCDALSDDSDLVIISRSVVQALFTEKRVSRKGANKLYPDHDKLDLAAPCFDHCVVDETHFYGNPFGLPFLLAQDLITDCVFRIGLTGTPVGRNPFVLWAQAALIDGGRHFSSSYKFFEGCFGEPKWAHFLKRDVMVFDKAKLPQFQYKLDRFSMSYGQHEIKGAPVIANQVRLEMLPDQRAAYNGVVRRLLATHASQREEIEATFIQMRQIASGWLNFTDDDGDQQTVHFPSIKLEWLKETITELPPDLPVVIFHEFIETGRLICDMLTAAKIKNVALRGETRDKTGAIADFQSGKVQVLVANAAAGGVGVDLPRADYLLFYESPVSPIVRAQAAARPMARGERVLVLDDLVCSPVEDKILSFISEGDNLLAKLLKGGGKSAKELLA